MGIALAVPGGVVSGNLVSYSSWCRKQAKLLEPSHSIGFYPYTEALIKTAEEEEEARRSTYDVVEKEPEPDPGLSIFLKRVF